MCVYVCGLSNKYLSLFFNITINYFYKVNVTNVKHTLKSYLSFYNERILRF